MVHVDKSEGIIKLVETMLPSRACKEHGVPYSTFLSWIEGNQQLVESYTRAKKSFTESLVNEMQDLLDAPQATNDKGNVDHGEVQLRKLRVDSIKWLLSKLHPRKYGDHLMLTGDEDNPIAIGQVTRIIVDKRKEIEE